MSTTESTWRRSDAYPCATVGCSTPGAWVETRPVQPNGMAGSLGFYGACEAHYAKAMDCGWHSTPRDDDHDGLCGWCGKVKP